MAPTFRHGKNAYFSVSSSTGGTINASSGLDDSNLERMVETAEVTTYGKGDKVYLAGLRDATCGVSGHFSSTHAKKLDAMLAWSTGTTWVWGPHGNSTGVTYRKYTGNAIITKLSYGAPLDDKVSFSMDLQVSGPITSTNF